MTIRDVQPVRTNAWGRSMSETIVSVPNQPKTPHSSFRIPPELKQAAAEKAKAEGKDLTQIVVKALERYIKR